MRRHDREVTERAKIDEIIKSCDCLRLGLNAEDGAYIVPLSFGYEMCIRDRAWRTHVHVPDLLRLLGLFRHGDWSRPDLRVPVYGELQAAVYLKVHFRILETVAHFAQLVFSGLCLSLIHI